MTKGKKFADAISKGDINGRFVAIISILYGGNKRAFANAIDISPSVIENVTGTRLGKPSFDVLRAVVECTEISAHWLLTGEGSMLNEADKAHHTMGVEEAKLQGRIEQLERDNALLRQENGSLYREIGSLSAMLDQRGCKATNSHSRILSVTPISKKED